MTRYVFRVPPAQSDYERAEDLRSWNELGRRKTCAN